MQAKPHRLIGCYATPEGAAQARDRLQAEGFAPQQLRVCQDAPTRWARLQADDGNDLLGPLLGAAARGLLAGLLIGLELALMLQSVAAPDGANPFGSAAVLVLLAGLVGAVLGAMLGAGRRGGLNQRVQRELARGKVVLVIKPASDEQARRARRLMRQS